MARRRTFLIIQSLLCVLAAGLLAAGALCLYFDGAAKQADGDLFCYMFTRERVAAMLIPVLPVVFAAFGMSMAGWILGIRDEEAEKPVRDEKLLREIGCVRENAMCQQADQRTVILRTAVLVIAVFLIILGIMNGGLEDVLAKGAAICTECIGLG